ncbi:GNAT family N-acetyltransferase [Clostridium sp. YIM B02515]|uniref:GNAT family N-acetyltransferase n=1 Tax=Clostridium rhizosphaerae TaxID=2803861 RepID=A0ABS1TIG1_9CLOT|nr:GNAT family N-acetyltransferase [Clostridium rhizosphaerae]MBL4938572.1 GNAT family N-acetyltransferase [Clostridium rhizosphaerae]
MMNNLFLIRPSKVLEREIWEYRQEYFDFGETQVNGSCGLAYHDNFDEWLNLVLSIEKDKLRNNVHTSTFFSIRKEDNKIIGSVKLHHLLTPDLENGAHIAYGIRPSERKKGYGKQQLLLVLDVARDMKIPKVMIACGKDNIASAKTALSCSGILTSEKIYEGAVHQHYWIDLRK